MLVEMQWYKRELKRINLQGEKNLRTHGFAFKFAMMDMLIFRRQISA